MGEPEVYLNDYAKEFLAKIQFIEHNDPAKVIDRIYAILGIMDAKASSLLTANALFLAVATFFFGPAITGVNQTVSSRVLFSYIDLILFAFSSGLCLMIVRINWRFIAKIKANATGFDLTSEQPHLARETFRRTRCYQFAWHMTVAGLVLIAILAGWKGV